MGAGQGTFKGGGHGSGRILQLDGLRAIAIVAVMIHHAFDYRLLWMGVDLFFVLSGFLITGILMAHQNEGLGSYFGRFYERRAKRIYPPYLLLLTVTTLLFGASWMRHAYMYVFLMNLMAPMRIAQPNTIALLWSLAVEEQFYLAWPFAVYLIKGSRVGWVAVGLMALAPLLRFLCTPLFAEHWAIYFLTPFRMDCLAAGALLAVVWSKHKAWIQRFGHYGIGLTAFAGGSLYLLSRLMPGFSTRANTRASNTLIYEISMMGSLGLVLWALSGKGVWILRWAPVRYIGRISYSMYLIHPTTLAVIRWYVASRGVSALLAFLATVAYAAASWQWLEQPLLGKRPAETSVVLAAAENTS